MATYRVNTAAGERGPFSLQQVRKAYAIGLIAPWMMLVEVETGRQVRAGDIMPQGVDSRGPQTTRARTRSKPLSLVETDDPPPHGFQGSASAEPATISKPVRRGTAMSKRALAIASIVLGTMATAGLIFFVAVGPDSSKSELHATAAEIQATAAKDTESREAAAKQRDLQRAKEQASELAKSWRQAYQAGASFQAWFAKEKPKLDGPLAQLAQEGDLNAQAIVGPGMYFGLGIDQDHARAVKLVAGPAGDGDAYAQNLLGVAHFSGQGVSEDKAVAAKWFSKAAAQGMVSAMFNLGVCLLDGHGAAADPELAAFWLRKAAVRGDASAMNRLADCMLDGVGVEQDHEEALSWYRKAAEKGLALAKENLKKCERLAAEALEAGDKAADEKRSADAWEQWSIAAALDNLHAKVKVAMLYASGFHEEGVLTIEKQPKKAARLYFDAMLEAYEDHELSIATYRLAEMFFHGNGFKADSDVALTLYQTYVRQTRDIGMRMVASALASSLSSMSARRLDARELGHRILAAIHD